MFVASMCFTCEVIGHITSLDTAVSHTHVISITPKKRTPLIIWPLVLGSNDVKIGGAYIPMCVYSVYLCEYM